jgi:hypothetical protein
VSDTGEVAYAPLIYDYEPPAMVSTEPADAKKRFGAEFFWYWLYVVVALLLVPVAVLASDFSGPDDGFTVVLVVIAPIFLVPVFRVLLRLEKPAGPMFLGEGMLTALVPWLAMAAPSGDISDTSLEAGAVAWALTIVVVAIVVVVMWHARARAGETNTSVVAPVGCGALLGCHVGTMVLAVAVSHSLATRGRSSTGFLGGTFYDRHGDWRLAIPFAVAGLIVFCAALVVEMASNRRWSVATIEALVIGVFAAGAVIGAVLAFGLAANWWSVPFVDPGGDFRSYSYGAAWILLPFFLAALVLIGFDWPSPRSASPRR